MFLRFLPLFLLAALPAQDMETRLAEKLKKEFFKKATWVTDYDKARDEARASGKPIFAYFTRSYGPCEYCAICEAGPLCDPKFVEFARPYVLFCHITTNIKGRKNDGLLSEKGGAGFPYVVQMDHEGNVVAKCEGTPNLDSFATMKLKAQDFIDLKKRAESGDRFAKFGYFIRAMELRHFTLEKAKRKAAELPDLSKDEKEVVNQALICLEVDEIFCAAGTDMAAGIIAAKKMIEMKKAGRIPTGGQAVGVFWTCIMEYAEGERLIPLYAEGLKALKEYYQVNPKNNQILAEKEATLKRMMDGK